MNERDERGIDLAIMAYVGALLCGEPDKAVGNAETMLTMFGFKKLPEAPHE